MIKRKDPQYAVLLVSASDQLNNFVKRVVSGPRFPVFEIRKSATLARRAMLERHFDIVLVSLPLPDEMGLEFALDAAERRGAAVLLMAPPEIAGDVTDHVIDRGIITIQKPLSEKDVIRNVRFLAAVQQKFREKERQVQRLEEKMEEIRIVNKAKWKLITAEGLSEEEAHARIGKLAMDRGLTRKMVAEEIIEKHENA